MTINRIDIKEFQEAGYLQEANRLFFHLFGLALEIEADRVCEECQTEWEKNATQCVKCGNRTSVLINHRLGGVWDYRDDPEGMVFVIENDDQLKDFKEKADRIRHEKEDRASVRMRMFHSGSPVQPLKRYVPRQDESTDDSER